MGRPSRLTRPTGVPPVPVAVDALSGEPHLSHVRTCESSSSHGNREKEREQAKLMCFYLTQYIHNII